jgi:hypothetical protein
MKDIDIQIGAVYSWRSFAMRSHVVRVIGRNTQYWKVRSAGERTPYNFALAADFRPATSEQLQRYLIDDFKP